MKKISLLFSAKGDLFKSIFDMFSRDPEINLVCAVTHNRFAKGVDCADNLSIPVLFLISDMQMSKVFKSLNINLIVCIEYMKILKKEFCNIWEGRCINIHPSLLPKYPGLHTHRRVLEAGDKEHGCTVYFVSPYLNSGIIIAQEKIEIVTGDTEKELSHKITECEKKLYPLVIQAICQERIVRKTNLIYFDGKLLTRPLSLKDF